MDIGAPNICVWRGGGGRGDVRKEGEREGRKGEGEKRGREGKGKERRRGVEGEGVVRLE